MKAQIPEGASEQGEFQRQEDECRDWVPEHAHAGRYLLYVSYACPWANRTMIVRMLKGLENAVGISIVDPLREERGWAFRPEPDPLNGFHFLSEAYAETNARFNGRVTVPVLWDKE